MTPGRIPPGEPDDQSTLFDPSRDPSAPVAERTPPPPTMAATEVGAMSDDVTRGPFPTPERGRPTDPSTTDGLTLSADGAATLKPGQLLFDRYIVVRQLGEGGMGTVWLVKHRELDSERALKLIVSGIARDEQARLRFRREALILDKLDHPNAVRVYDARMGREVAYIEMELVRGQSLNQVLVPGKAMPLEFASELLEQLCDVLQAANEAGIIHRDLKPPNLMLVDGRKPGTKILKLLDFGIAKIREGGDDVRTITGSFMGTPLYSSPEQIVGERVDARSDIYSVGLILYEILTGHRPFDGSINAIIYKHTMVPPPRFAEVNPANAVPPPIEDVVLKCLAKDPDLRPQTPRALAELFQDALDAAAGKKVRPRTEVPRPPKPPGLAATAELAGPASSRRLRAILLGVLAIMAVVLVILAARRPGPSVTPEPSPSPGVTAAPSPAARPLPADPKALRRQMEETLERWKGQGYAIPSGAGKTAAGWPLKLERTDDNATVVFRRDPSGVYLPDGYKPDPDGGLAEDHYPRILRRDDGATFVRIKGDTFSMGSLAGSVEPDDLTAPAHPVTLSGFYIQTTEVTNGEMELYFGGKVPEDCKEWKRWFEVLSQDRSAELARNYPARGISWRTAALYAQAKGGRLPTEAQWEFTARSRGQKYLNVWDHQGPLRGRELEGAANLIISPSPLGNTAPVGQFKAHDVTVQNVLDMAGNVREWCRDTWDRYHATKEPVVDPQLLSGPDTPKVVRGGSFNSFPELGQTTARDDRGHPGDDDTSEIGFRIVIECPYGPPDPP